MTDTERLDYLQKLTKGTSHKIVCRWSQYGRGWRLHETTRDGGVDDIREAIDKFINQIEESE